MKTLRWLWRERRWPSQLQRWSWSRDPRKIAAVRAVADRIIAELEADE